MSNCEWCGNEFIKRTNQVYCSVVCRESATKHKISQHYQRNVLVKRRGQHRPCRMCGKQLSIYNPGRVCNQCQSLLHGRIKPADIMRRIIDEDIGY